MEILCWPVSDISIYITQRCDQLRAESSVGDFTQLQSLSDMAVLLPELSLQDFPISSNLKAAFPKAEPWPALPLGVQAVWSGVPLVPHSACSWRLNQNSTQNLFFSGVWKEKISFLREVFFICQYTCISSIKAFYVPREG